MRAVPIQVEPGAPEAILITYSADEDIDPFMGMFFFPKDTLKMVLWEPGRGVRWRREFHAGVIPGEWFCPVLPFDLDADGADEIWMVVNADPAHPLDIKKFGLERIDPRTGATVARHKWRGLDYADYTASQRYRHFLAGGHAGGEPVLVCVQGTYSRIQIQGMRADGSLRWETNVGKDDRGARACHNCPVVDFDQDGDDEIFIGERCLRLRDGTALFIADEHMWNGHSDVVAPVWNETEKAWSLFTARESPYAKPAPPRVVAYGPTGRRRWADLEEGHMDMGWVARIGAGGKPLAYALLLGGKSAGPGGFVRSDCIEYFWDPFTGERQTPAFSAFERLPIDIDGDGLHELIGSNSKQAEPNVIDATGRILGTMPDGSRVVHVSKLVPTLPGEQVVAFTADGRVRLIGCRPDADPRPGAGLAVDTAAAKARYAHPFYRRNRQLTAVGYNLNTLGGL
jgi:hypothetical protein